MNTATGCRVDVGAHVATAIRAATGVGGARAVALGMSVASQWPAKSSKWWSWSA